MSIIKNSDIIFTQFEQEYAKRNAMRIKLVDDSVILVCGLRTSFSRFFEVYYACIPVFSHFNISSTFLDEATAFNVGLELGNTGNPLPTNPKPEEIDSVVRIASDHAEFAKSRLERIRSLNDCLSFYEEEHRKSSMKSPGYVGRRKHIDILLFKKEFDKCRAMLETALFERVKAIFSKYNRDLPENGDWRQFLPNEKAAIENEFQRDLFQSNESYWKRIRVSLDNGEKRALCEELMQNYLDNKKLLKRIGILVGEKADAMMDELMFEVI